MHHWLQLHLKIFVQAYVNISVEREGGVACCRYSPIPHETATEVHSTHPTGMLSCVEMLNQKCRGGCGGVPFIYHHLNVTEVIDMMTLYTRLQTVSKAIINSM